MNLKLLATFVGVAVFACGLTDGAPWLPPISTDGSRFTKDNPKPKDYFEDQIRLILRMSVKELLEATMTTFSNLNRLTAQGIQELDSILNQATPQVKEELLVIKGKVENQIFSSLNKLIGDLASVLPSLSQVEKEKTIHQNEETMRDVVIAGVGDQVFSAADIIWALLNLSLQAFVELITGTLQTSINLLGSVINEFQGLENLAGPEVSNTLEHIAENYLEPARRAAIPLLDNLRKVVDSKIKKGM